MTRKKTDPWFRCRPLSPLYLLICVDPWPRFIITYILIMFEHSADWNIKCVLYFEFKKTILPFCGFFQSLMLYFVLCLKISLRFLRTKIFFQRFIISLLVNFHYDIRSLFNSMYLTLYKTRSLAICNFTYVLQEKIKINQYKTNERVPRSIQNNK